MRLFTRICVVLLPVALFAVAMLPVRAYLGRAEALNGIALLLAALAVLALLEGLLFRFYLLPQLGESISEHVYGGSYFPADDALACAVARAEKDSTPEALAALAEVVRAQSDRTRGWLELARLQQDAGKPEAAAETLAEGAAAVREREDCALLLYRAAHLYADALHRPERAAQLCAEAASRYPETVYGRRAAEKA